jgi:hypothetical protein
MFLLCVRLCSSRCLLYMKPMIARGLPLQILLFPSVSSTLIVPIICSTLLCILVCFFIADDLVTGAQAANTPYIPVFLPNGSSFVTSGILNVSIQVGFGTHSTPISDSCYSSPDRMAQPPATPWTDIPSNSTLSPSL